MSAFETRAFPAWVAFCTAVTVAVATGVTVDDSVPARVAAGFAGLAAGIALSFAFASVLPAARERGRAAAPAPVRPTAEAPTAVAHIDDRRGRLEQHLAAADPDGDVEGWIARAHTLVEETVPGASGYFSALGARAFPDERTRLETYVGRLQTIARDFI